MQFTVLSFVQKMAAMEFFAPTEKGVIRYWRYKNEVAQEKKRQYSWQQENGSDAVTFAETEGKSIKRKVMRFRNYAFTQFLNRLA